MRVCACLALGLGTVLLVLRYWRALLEVYFVLDTLCCLLTVRSAVARGQLLLRVHVHARVDPVVLDDARLLVALVVSFIFILFDDDKLCALYFNIVCTIS